MEGTEGEYIHASPAAAAVLGYRAFGLAISKFKTPLGKLVDLIAHSLRLLAFCFGHDAGLETVVVVVVVGYGHMYDARTAPVPY
jgi:hypothetical protein